MSHWNQYISPNIGLLFYKQIYREDFVKTKLKIEEKEGSRVLLINIPNEEKTSPFDSFYKDLYALNTSHFTQIENLAANTRFHLLTTYPGLLVGSGYQHDTKAKGDFKIGFFFDHTTGQPIIPGSSVKGVLHSLFEIDVVKEGGSTKNATGEKSLASIRFICTEIIEKAEGTEKIKWQNMRDDLTKDTLKALAASIFGSTEKEGTDVFYDAVIHLKKTGMNHKIISNDFITPHKANPLKNPIPLQFLKVLPNVVFEFRFCLKDSDENWTAERKKRLFLEILLTLGIGAKTNVGYGQFRDPNAPPSSGQSGQRDREKPSILKKGVLKDLKNNDIVRGKIESTNNGIKVTLIDISDATPNIPLQRRNDIQYKVGDIYEIKIERVKNGRIEKISHTTNINPLAE